MTDGAGAPIVNGGLWAITYGNNGAGSNLKLRPRRAAIDGLPSSRLSRSVNRLPTE